MLTMNKKTNQPLATVILFSQPDIIMAPNVLLWERWTTDTSVHDDVIKWKHFPRYWPFMRGILRSPVNFPHKGQWCGALMFSLICSRINGWVNNGDAGDLRRHRAHYDVTVMDFTDYWGKGTKKADLMRPPNTWLLLLIAYCCSNNWVRLTKHTS